MNNKSMSYQLGTICGYIIIIFQIFSSILGIYSIVNDQKLFGVLLIIAAVIIFYMQIMLVNATSSLNGLLNDYLKLYLKLYGVDINDEEK